MMGLNAVKGVEIGLRVLNSVTAAYGPALTPGRAQLSCMKGRQGIGTGRDIEGEHRQSLISIVSARVHRHPWPTLEIHHQGRRPVGIRAAITGPADWC